VGFNFVNFVNRIVETLQMLSQDCGEEDYVVDNNVSESTLDSFPQLSQWACSAKASTSYKGGWEARTMTGPPRVYPSYGDIPGAWAASVSAGAYAMFRLFVPLLVIS
jgi:hypothetical protein